MGVASIGLAVVAASQLAGAAAPLALGDLANDEGIFVNMKTFKVVKGASPTDTAAQITKLGARPVTEGAIIFRSGNQLYIVDAVPGGGQMNLLFEGAFAPPG
jgi:hypothetical protein